MVSRWMQVRCAGWLVVLSVACGPDAATVPTRSEAPPPRAPDAATVVTRVKPPAAKSAAVTPADLFAHPEWVGTSVTVELREDLLDDQSSSGAPPGGYDVSVMDLGARRLHLVPAAPGEAGLATMAELTPPIRVTGMLKAAKFGLDIVPTKIEALAFEAPLKLATAAEILTNPAVTSGMVVEVTGEWVVGFEASLLDREIWVSGYQSGKRLCEPVQPRRPQEEGYTTARVRIVGLVYKTEATSTRGGYGHLNMRAAEIKALEMEWLSPRDPRCK